MERMTYMMGYGYHWEALVVDALRDEPAHSDGNQAVDVFKRHYKSKQPARLIPKCQRCHLSWHGYHSYAPIVVSADLIHAVSHHIHIRASNTAY